jgi:hypothetical protein
VKHAILTLLLLATSIAVAQQDAGAGSRGDRIAQPLTEQDVSEHSADALHRIASSMGRYARDISEIPLNVDSEVLTFDATGTLREKKESSHTLQFVTRSYGQGLVKRHLRMNKTWLHRVSQDEVNGDSATAVLALLFDNGRASPAYRYNLILHSTSKRLEATITNDRACQGFDPTVRQKERNWCGETNLVLDSETLEPVNASFAAGGFPRTFGRNRYLSFKFVEEFQRIGVEDTKEPFLLPAKVLVTYESDRGRTVIESKFSVKSEKHD